MKPKIALRAIQLLLIILLSNLIYSWVINVGNTSIAYNKERTYLSLKEKDIKNSQDILFLKNEAIEAINTIRSKNKQMHKTANFFFLSLPVQAIIVLIVFIICIFIYKKLSLKYKTP